MSEAGLSVSVWCVYYILFVSVVVSLSVQLRLYLCSYTFCVQSGAHNDVRSGRESRSVQRPRKRLNFENVPTLVPLLFWSRTCHSQSSMKMA